MLNASVCAGGVGGLWELEGGRHALAKGAPRLRSLQPRSCLPQGGREPELAPRGHRGTLQGRPRTRLPLFRRPVGERRPLPCPCCCPVLNRVRHPCPLPQARRRLSLARMYLTTLHRSRITLQDFQCGVAAAYAAHDFRRRLQPLEVLQLALQAGFPPAAAAAITRAHPPHARLQQTPHSSSGASDASDTPGQEGQARPGPAAAGLPAWRYRYFMWWLRRCAPPHPVHRCFQQAAAVASGPCLTPPPCASPPAPSPSCCPPPGAPAASCPPWSLCGTTGSSCRRCSSAALTSRAHQPRRCCSAAPRSAAPPACLHSLCCKPVLAVGLQHRLWACPHKLAEAAAGRLPASLLKRLALPDRLAACRAPSWCAWAQRWAASLSASGQTRPACQVRAPPARRHAALRAGAPASQPARPALGSGMPGPAHPGLHARPRPAPPRPAPPCPRRRAAHAGELL